MARVLAQAVHYPRPEFRADLIDTMRGLHAATAGLDGLESIGAFEDVEGGRIIAISLWSSPEAMGAGMAAVGSAVADVPFDVWELQPSELSMMPETAITTEV